MENDLTEKLQKHKWLSDKAIAVATLMAIMINIVLAITSIYYTNYSEYKKKYWEARMATYLEISSSAGNMTVYYADTLKMKELKKQFYGMYYGKSDMFRDIEVNNALKEYKDVLEKFSPDGSDSYKKYYLEEL